MVKVGDISLQPEKGFRRVDSDNLSYRTDGEIEIYGKSGFVEGNGTYLHLNGSLSFEFYGTQFYIVSDRTSTTFRSANIKVNIDGIDELIITDRNSSGTDEFKIIQYVSKELEEKYHHVTITNCGGEGTTTHLFVIDAIDVKGHICPYTLKQNSIRNAEVGDYILADYTPKLNEAGEFSNIGGSDAEHCFVCVESSGKRKMFVSNKNIDKVTFDNLNRKGYVYGRIIESSYMQDISVRLLSGGNKTNTHSDEWYKAIVSNSLGGKISPGDNAIWNWKGGWSHTRSLISTPVDIINKGNTNVDDSSTTKSTTLSGYRPVIVVDIKYNPPIFELDFLRYGTYKYGSCYPLGIKNIILDPSIDTEKQVVKVSVVNTNNDVVIMDSEYVNIKDIKSNITLENDMLEEGKVNNLKIVITDINKEFSSKYVKVYALHDSFVISNSNILTKGINILSNKILIHVEPYNAVTYCSIDGNTFFNVNFNDYSAVKGSKLKLLMFESNEKISSYGIAFC